MKNEKSKNLKNGLFEKAFLGVVGHVYESSEIFEIPLYVTSHFTCVKKIRD